ncbi:hypothetical protein D9M69_669380 [compost metagenome]
MAVDEVGAKGDGADGEANGVEHQRAAEDEQGAAHEGNHRFAQVPEQADEVRQADADLGEQEAHGDHRAKDAGNADGEAAEGGHEQGKAGQGDDDGLAECRVLLEELADAV